MIRKTFETPGELRLDLRVPAGRVEVETHDGTQTEVELSADREEALEDAIVELRGDKLVVNAERKKTGWSGFGINIDVDLGFRNPKYELVVRCPHGAHADIATASADVEVRGRVGNLEVKTASGDVEAQSAASAQVKTASGDVTIADVDGDARVQTVSGDVNVARVGGKTAAQVVSGDLHLGDAGDSVVTKAVSGDVTLSAVERGEVNVTSVSGDVEIGVRRGSAVHVDATSVSGSMESELELGDAPPTSHQGSLVELRARSVSGDIRVLRAPARETQPAA
jgi:hypothetical protein